MELFWLATSKHLYAYNGKEVYLAKEFPFDFNVRKIVKLKNNGILFCTINSGVFIKTDDGVKSYSSSANSLRNVFSAFQDTDGKLYIGTVGGLCEI